MHIPFKAVSIISYLKELPATYNTELNPDISFCHYLDKWLKGRKSRLRESTYEVYDYRISTIKKYFENWHYKQVDITPKILDTYFWAFAFCFRALSSSAGYYLYGCLLRLRRSECLAKVKEEQKQNEEFFQSDYQNIDGYVFTWENGKPYNPDYTSKRKFICVKTAFSNGEFSGL